MKRLLVLCVVSVAMVSICQKNEEIWIPELEEVVSSSACPCSKSCRCRIIGCRGCCDQDKDEGDKTKSDGMCVAAYCDCELARCSCYSGNSGCCS